MTSVFSEERRRYRIINAFKAKTVERGCTPAEAAAARAKLSELESARNADDAYEARYTGAKWKAYDEYLEQRRTRLKAQIRKCAEHAFLFTPKQCQFLIDLDAELTRHKLAARKSDENKLLKMLRRVNEHRLKKAA
jgi:hypothetical protein